MIEIEAPEPVKDERQVEVEQAVRQLSAKNPKVRSQAAKRLGELRAAPEALLPLLTDPNPYVRSAAAFALGYAAPMGEDTSEIVEQLLSAIDDANDYVAASAIHSLGLLRSAAAAGQIEACLDDDNPFVAQAAILALARIEQDQAVTAELGERIAAFLETDQYLLLLSASRAIYLLNYRPAAPRLLAALERVIGQRGQRDFKLPKALIDTLAKLDAKAAVPVLVQIAQSEVGLRSVAVEALIQLRAEETAPLLVPMLQEPSEGLRRRLIELMIAANYQAALPLIRPLLHDPSAQIREAVLSAVQSWGDAQSAEAVRRMAFSDPNPFVRPKAVACWFALRGDATMTDLLALLRDTNAYVRQAAARALGGVSSPTREVLQALEGWLEDPQMGEVARESLQELANRPVQAPPSQPPAEQPVPSLVPAELDREGLASQLENWQASLARLGTGADWNEVAGLDEALSRLIVLLRQDPKP